MGASPHPGRAPAGGRPRPTTSAGAHDQAWRIAAAVAQAWHTAFASDRPEIPLSVVAALALRTPDTTDERTWITSRLLGADDDGLLGFLRATWTLYATVRPDLAHRIVPLAAPWYTDPLPGPDLMRAVRRVVQVALGAGLHELLDAARFDVDLLGPLLSTLRTPKARAARGQEYTPDDVADLLVRLGGVPEPGQSICEPTAGTGGLLRAVAQAIRDTGGDPHTRHWVAVDLDELAVAALAVNTVIWDLGPHVLIAHGDALTDDWQPRAVGQRAETLTLLTRLHGANRALDLLRSLTSTSTSTDADSDTDDP
jgi:hypothetical protein